MSDSPTEMVKIPRALLERLTDTLGWANPRQGWTTLVFLRLPIN